MQVSDVLSFARVQAQTDSNGLTDAKGIVLANEANSDFHRRLVAGGVDASQLQEAYMSGTANQGTYLYPTDMLFLKAIEVNFTDTQESNYVTAQQVDVSNLSGGPRTSFSWLRANADPMSPQFDDRGDWFEVFPTPTASRNLTNLFRIFYFLKPTAYSATSDTVAYPESLDTAILGWRIAAMWYYSLNKMLEGDAFNQKYDERVRQYVSTLSRGVQSPQQATPIQDSGWGY